MFVGAAASPRVLAVVGHVWRMYRSRQRQGKRGLYRVGHCRDYFAALIQKAWRQYRAAAPSGMFRPQNSAVQFRTTSPTGKKAMGRHGMFDARGGTALLVNFFCEIVGKFWVASG